MPEEFRSLAALLREPAVPLDPVTADEEEPQTELPCDADPLADALRDVRLFRARLAERLDCALETLLNDIGALVLARELELAPAQLQSIVERALAQAGEEEPVRIRVAAPDASRLRFAIPVVSDPSLREGDALIEVRDGAIDVSLGVRLNDALRAALAW